MNKSWMKYAVLATTVLFLAGCGGIQTPGDVTPIVGSLPAPSSIVPSTPTISLVATTMPVPVTATPTQQAGTPVPSNTPRLNSPRKPGTGILLTSMQMFDSQKGWGFDSEYHILRTHDGGKTWQDVTPPAGYYSPAGFFALDADTAWATYTVGLYSNPTTAYVVHTQDGGMTWLQSEEFRLDIDQYGEPYSSEFYLPQGLQFIDRNTGWLLAAVSYNMSSARALLFNTTDGGHTWTTVNSRTGLPDACVAVGFVFIDSQTGWLGGNCFAQGVVSNRISSFVVPDGWAIFKTVNGGDSYEEKTFIPLPEEFQQPDLLQNEGNCGEIQFEWFADDVIGVEWGCSIFTPLKPDYRYFALSADHGQSWMSWPSTGNEFFLDAKHGWRLLSGGELQQTINGGTTWETIKRVTWEDARFDFVSEQEGWAIASIGQSRAFLHTLNGGRTWTELHPRIGP